MSGMFRWSEDPEIVALALAHVPGAVLLIWALLGRRRPGRAGIGDEAEPTAPGPRWWAVALAAFLLVSGPFFAAGAREIWWSASVGIEGTGLLLTAVLASGVGVYLIWWGSRGDRSRGLPRCPQCSYDMRGHVGHSWGMAAVSGATSGTGPAGLACPECGYEVATAAELYPDQRRGWAVRSGAVVVVLTWVLLGALTLAEHRMDDWPWLAAVLLCGLASVPLVAGAALVWFGLRGDRGGRGPRCPRCEQEMHEQVYGPAPALSRSPELDQPVPAGLTCRACGHVSASPFVLLRPRRDRHRAVLGVALLLPYVWGWGHLFPATWAWHREQTALRALTAPARLRFRSDWTN